MAKTQTEQLDDILKQALNVTPHGQKRSDDIRKEPRFRIAMLPATCYVTQPGGSRSEAPVHVIDVSAGGCKLVYPGFLHAETEVRVSVDTPSSRRHSIVGVVAWCRFVSDRYHSVGIRSDDMIEIRHLVDPEEWRRYQAGLVRPDAPLTGTVVHYSHDALTRFAVRLHLERAECQLLFADDAGELNDRVACGDADAVILDIDGDNTSPLDLMLTLRDIGFAGPLILISSNPETAGLLSLDPLEYADFVRKPMRSDALLAALKGLLSACPGSAGDTSPLHSSLPESPSRFEILTDSIEMLRELAERAVRQYESDDIAGVEAPLRSMIANAGSFGFPALTTAAARCHEHLQDQSRARWIGADLRRLMTITHRLTADSRPDRDEESDA